MHIFLYRMRPSSYMGLFLGCFLFFASVSIAQQNSVVQVHADKNSGYGVAYGGPQNIPDLIVTALHVVAGKSTIVVNWQGRSAYATVERIYKPSDLALLRLQTSLGVPPLTLYSGDTPWDTNVNFWEIPINSTAVNAKTTVLEERTSLSRISPRIANNPTGLAKSLCADAGQYYPGMNTEVINFKEPNIRKAHSGSPLTYGNKILGLVDGGAKLIDGKSCVWAIPAADFNKLFNQGTAPTQGMQACGGATGNAYMYSGMRSDNPLLSREEAGQAAQFEAPGNFTARDGSNLQLYHDYRMNFSEVYETLFPEEQSELGEIFASEDRITLNDMLRSTIDLYVEANTGITVMVPAQCNLTASSDGSGTYLTTTSPGGLITMSVYIFPNYDMNQGLNTMGMFKSALASYGYNTVAESDDIEDYRDDEYTPYYSEYVETTFHDDEGEVAGEFFADLMVNDGDFMAITVSISDWNSLDNNPTERLYLYLLETCALYSDFGIY